MAVWFTADTHFGHDNIRKHCKRPFRTLATMDRTLWRNWNDRVKPNDTVYHLGDFAWGRGAQLARHYRSLLNGTIIFVYGNHDNSPTRADENMWDEKGDYIEDVLHGTRLVLFHYPIHEWNRWFNGSWHLHGHTHGSVPDAWHRVDVGVDNWDFRPVSFDEIMKRNQKEFPDDPRGKA